MNALASFDEYMSYRSTQDAAGIGTLGFELAPIASALNRLVPSPKSVPVDATLAGEWENVTRLPSEIDVTLARLRSFKEWPDNWDGEGSPAPSHEIIDSATELYSLLVNTRLRFRAHLGGTIPVFFIKDPAISGEIVVESPSEISFSFEKGGATREDFCLAFDRKQLPPALGEALEAMRD